MASPAAERCPFRDVFGNLSLTLILLRSIVSGTKEGGDMLDGSYLTARVKEALDKSSGDVKAARRLLARWAAGDHRLLQELVGPFLPGIIAHTVGGGVEPHRVVPMRRRRKASALTPDALDQVVGALGEKIGTTHQPAGMTALTNPAKPTPAGAGHERSVRALAVAFARKRLEG